MRETTIRLEKQLAKEQAARLKFEEDAKQAQKKFDEEIRNRRGRIGIVSWLDSCPIL